jgi:threonyl-tRNA synthetase
MIHRAIAGSFERFLSVIIEHFAGAFPVWLAPVQVAILPIADAHRDYAKEVEAALRAADVRTELYDQDETLGKRIRSIKMQKIPYFLVVGDDEVKAKTVTVEDRDKGKIGAMAITEFMEKFL